MRDCISFQTLFFIKNIKDSREVYAKQSKDAKALFGCILLGKEENKNDVDKYSNPESSYDEAERCAEAGFEILKDKYISADSDETTFENRLIKELKVLYEKNVNSNI